MVHAAEKILFAFVDDRFHILTRRHRVARDIALSVLAFGRRFMTGFANGVGDIIDSFFYTI